MTVPGENSASGDLSVGDASLLRLASFLRSSALTIFLTASVFVAIAVVASLLMTKMYRAQASYQYVADREQAGAGLGGGALGALSATLGGGLLEGSDSSKSALARMNSRQFMVEFAQQQSLVAELFDERWDKEASAWAEGQSEPSPWEISGRLDERINAVADSKSGLIRVSVTWEDPDRAVDLINRFVAKANRELRADAEQRTTARLTYLTRTLDETRLPEVRESIASLIKQEVERNAMINLEEEYALRRVVVALAPDADEYVSPNRKLLVASALFFGFVLGALIGYARLLASASRRVEARSPT